MGEGVDDDTALTDVHARSCSAGISERWDDEGMMCRIDGLMKSEQSKSTTL